MGDGRIFRCEKCNGEFAVATGSGMAFPGEYEEIVKKIKKGKYGEEYKELMLSRNDIVVNLDRCLYVCDKCKNWYVNNCFDFYVPKDKEISKKVAEKNFYLAPWEISEDYELILKTIHICDKCDGKMRKVDTNEEYSLNCLECNSVMKNSGCIYWD